MVETKDWREQCKLLQAELDKIIKERDEWKEKWERVMQFKDAPRPPLRGRTDKLTTVGWDSGEDWK